MLGMGFDWGQPFTCESWVDDLGLTFPILDDDTDGDGDGGEGWELFALQEFIPYYEVINHNMEIIHSSSEWNDGGNNIMSLVQDALEECGTLCLSRCSAIAGDVDGTENETHEPIINLMDLLRLADIVESGQEIDECLALTGDLSNDGLVDIIDVYAFATMLVEGNFDN